MPFYYVTLVRSKIPNTTILFPYFNGWSNPSNVLFTERGSIPILVKPKKNQIIPLPVNRQIIHNNFQHTMLSADLKRGPKGSLNARSLQGYDRDEIC